LFQFTASETALVIGINDLAGFEATAPAGRRATLRRWPSRHLARTRPGTFPDITRCGDRVVGKERPGNRRVTIV
jgi:hypothetical protein